MTTLGRSSAWLAVAMALLVVGCKKKEKDAVVTDPVVAGSGAVVGSTDGTDGGMAGSGMADSGAAQGDFPLAAGESYYGGSAMATNLVNWKVEDGTTVQLGIVNTGTSADGRQQGVLRAYHVGSETHDVDQTYSLDPKAEHWAELKVLGNNRVLFRYGEAGESRRARNGVLLRWDADAKRVRLAKRWSGASKDAEPDWFLTGEFKAAPENESLCLEVIKRMVACEKDAKFREKLFHRDDPAAKTAMQEHFDTHVVKWKKPAEAKAQCQKWASDEYVDTSFSEKTKLQRLAAEKKHACDFFAAEIVDEGGLPIALTDAKQHPAGTTPPR
ncbi:MAG: hypothetical protein M3680_05925 [Myxococcota bacterium]|nr:hypothetical protein [Myxococcota bacterium]